MKFFILILTIIFLTKNGISENIFDTKEQILKFNSDNINITKNQYIDNIKIISFKSILKKSLNNKNYNNLKKNIDIKFVNKFLLNITINDEKIVGNNYFSKIKVNFNKNLIIDYFILNKIKYVNILPNNFLLIVYEENEIESNLLTKKNSYYNYLLSENIESFNNFYLLPNLNFNDRFILSIDDFKKNSINKFSKLNKKYITDYQIIIHSKKVNKITKLIVYLTDGKDIYKVLDKKKYNLDYFVFYSELMLSVIDKWKYLNQIDTGITNMVDCNVSINNIEELKFVTKLFKTIKVIKKFNLKSINLNNNYYEINYFGNLNTLQKILESHRLNLSFNNNNCKINLI